jgi:hypothetical protein
MADGVRIRVKGMVCMAAAENLRIIGIKVDSRDAAEDLVEDVHQAVTTAANSPEIG